MLEPSLSGRDDASLMTIAVALASRGLGQTAPNPSVGVVIVDPATGEIIARGRTQRGGRPHAETDALSRAGERARGATLYTTLEPCSHFGKTPPCADAIIAAKISRVVMALTDPDPRVAGRGRDKLKAAGIEVEDRLPDEVIARARAVTLGHILRVCERRPLVELKLAVTSDGTAPKGEGAAPTFVTNALSRQVGHLMRARADAILVGRKTVHDDNPDLRCRLPGMADRSPIRVVLARSADVPATSNLVKSARDVPVIVYHEASADLARRLELERAGVVCQRVQAFDDGLWLPAVLEDLASRGVTRLLVEGGPQIWRAFLKARLVDRLSVFVAGAPASMLTPERALAPHFDWGARDHGFRLGSVGDVGQADRLFTLERQPNATSATE